MSEVGDIVELDGHRYKVVAIGDEQGRFDPGVSLPAGDYWADGLLRFHLAQRSVVESFTLSEEVDGPVRILMELS